MLQRDKAPSIAIIGAGLSGLCMAIRLKENGFSNFTIFEKAGDVGGTWRENTYPGVACDVPSHLYSFSFAPKPDWSKVFSPGPEIQEYIQQVTEKYDLRPHMRLGAKLTGAEWLDGSWLLAFENGDKVRADYFISGMGGLHIPRYPDIPGMERYKGTAYHTAAWNHDHDLTGKRVAVIGTAASAIQLIPEIADKVAHLDVYQRTPNWILPRPFLEYSDRMKRLFGRLPLLEKLHRLQIYLMFEMRFPLFRRDKFFSRRASKMFTKHLEEQVKDESLQAKLTPDYPIGCKRILASDVYFPALQRDNVELITDPITSMDESGVTAGGTHRAVDTVIYATGFKPWDQMEDVTITGKDGLDMRSYMKGGIRAHRTVAMPGFPNHFMLLGPNSGLGHNSVILMIEAQVGYIVDALRQARAGGAKVVEARADAADAYDKKLQHDLEGTVWAGHCKSWYQGEDGRIYTLWPWGTRRYMREMKRVNLAEYELTS
ncbi:flavin-containing monooxygenase [Kordiimonas sp.]|uniref:flavin-containing monooxygenase n=1 Tax=Kordiimonas sp. TaxID=1970157 RepID=UPI003A93C7D3